MLLRDLAPKLRTWQDSIGGTALRRIFAVVVGDLLSEFVDWSYTGHYVDAVAKHLTVWINIIFTPFIISTLHFLRQNDPENENPLFVSEALDQDRWLQMGFTRLGVLRVHELYHIVVNWEDSKAAVDDLRRWANNPAARTFLTTKFSNALSARLLQPGASTTHILRIYISIIRAFYRLDPKGVLLARVAILIRRYLRDRDDTVSVIVAGLFSDDQSEVTDDQDENLSELASELMARDPYAIDEDDGELDWDNMEWLPDPIDAAPDHIKSTKADVIGSLISLFDSKEVFVKKLQSALAIRLLRNTTDFKQEIAVIQHLKARLGESLLQGCEVMLRDVMDSRNVDAVIRRSQHEHKNADTSTPEFILHTKILSRLFWPNMNDQDFEVPDEIHLQHRKFEKDFEAIKQSRKLTWLNSLGHVEIDLYLEDREFHEEVLPWQAAVIAKFDDDNVQTSSAEPIKWSTALLSESLNMMPALVRSACMFWVSKRVLIEVPSTGTPPSDTYTVLERLDQLPAQTSSPTSAGNNLSASDNPTGISQTTADMAAAAAASALKEAEDAQRQEQMAMYHQFVISMLTNQGPQPLSRIAMILNMTVPGFNYSNEELKELLESMVRGGKVELGHGGAYKVTS